MSLINLVLCSFTAASFNSYYAESHTWSEPDEGGYSTIRELLGNKMRNFAAN